MPTQHKTEIVKIGLRNRLYKIKNYILSHKKLVGVIVVVVAVASYFIFRTKNIVETSYITAPVVRSDVVASVVGDGQIIADQSLVLTPKASGLVTYVGASEGQAIKSGTIIARIDSTQAQKAVRDAQVNLDSARLDLQRAQAVGGNTDESRSDAIKNAYRSLLNSTVEAVSISGTNTANQVEAPVISGNYILDKEGVIDITMYPSSGGYSFRVTGLTSGTDLASTATPKPIGNSGLYIKFSSLEKQADITWRITLPNTKASNYLSNYNTYQNLLVEQRQSGQQSIVSDIDLKTKQLSVVQRANALTDARQALDDYTVRAPFAGTLSSVTVKKFDTVSSGISLATLIGRKQVAEVTMNEVDVARVEAGQVATLTFDAIDDFSILGKVVSIDPVGTVTSGVVNYGVTIGYDSSDVRIKPGMSVSAMIVTDTKKDVIVVPNSSIKNQNGKSYVEVLDSSLGTAATKQSRSTGWTPKDIRNPSESPVDLDTRATEGVRSKGAGQYAGRTRPTTVQGSVTTVPRKVFIEVGVSNDSVTEVVSGLAEGESIVTKTITGDTTSAKTTTAPSLFGAATGGRSGGAATRAMTGGNRTFGVGR